MLRRVLPTTKISSCLLPRAFSKSTGFCVASSSSCVLLHQQASIHERLPRVNNYLSDEYLDSAKSALVQLNVMVSQGIEPDAMMYTSLITIMGRAKLEWQAFKLFSRMLEQGVKPLPETYLALRKATNPKRVRMIEQIEQKMAEMNDLLAEQLMNADEDAKEKSRRKADRQMREMMNPTLSSIPSTSNLKNNSDLPEEEEEEEEKQSENKNKNQDEVDDLKFHYIPGTGTSGNFKNMSAEDIQRRNEKIAELWKEGKDIPTMKLDSIDSVMATVKYVDARRAHQKSLASGEQRAKLKSQLLAKLHDEELRIMLTIHRQPRNGTRQQLIHRVLSEVPAEYLEQTLERRSHYFDSVKQILELQIEELESIEGIKKNKDNAKGDEDEEEDHEGNVSERKDLSALRSQIESRRKMQRGSDEEISIVENNNNNVKAVALSSPDAGNNNHNNNEKILPKSATQLTSRELYDMAPTHLEAPWGLIRKPKTLPPSPSVVNPERDENARLTQQELAEIQNALLGGNFDQVSQRSLRRYCRQFHLKWSRLKGAKALQDLVEWHMRNFKPAAVGGITVSPSSSSLSGTSLDNMKDENQNNLDAFDAEEEERRARHETLDQYNALVAVGRITDNMRLVDDSSVSRRVIERQQIDRANSKTHNAEIEKEKYQQRLDYLNENMRKMPIGHVSSSSASTNKNDGDRRVIIEDVLTKPGQSTPSRVIGSEAIYQPKHHQQQKTAADVFNEQLIVTSLGNELQQEKNQREQQDREGEKFAKALEHSNIEKNPNSKTRPQELPPWEANASSSSVPFNLRTGRFDIGVNEAEFYEDATGRYKVRRPQILKHQYRVDEQLLPAPIQARIRQEKLAFEHEMELEENDLGKSSFKRKRFRDFIAEKKSVEREEKERRISEIGRPLAAPTRMAKKLSVKSNMKPILYKSNSSRRRHDNNRRDESDNNE